MRTLRVALEMSRRYSVRDRSGPTISRALASRVNASGAPLVSARKSASSPRTTAASRVTSRQSQVRVKQRSVGFNVVTTAVASSATRYFAWYFTTGSAYQVTTAPISSSAPHNFLRRFLPPLARLVRIASTLQPRSSAAASASSTDRSSQRNSDRTSRRFAEPITRISASRRSPGSKTTRSPPGPPPRRKGAALASLGRRPGDILDALLSVAHELRAQLLERVGGLERGEVADRGLITLRDLARLEDDAVDGKHLMHVRGRELAAIADDLDEHGSGPLRAEHIQDWNHQAQEHGAQTRHRQRTQAGGHSQAHQDEEDGDIARVLDRGAEANDAGGAGNAERAGQRAADDDHHHRPRYAEQHLCLIERRIG